ncbi:MAG: DNA recombination protein RmuC, partial [Lactococcus cremoris]
LQKVMTGVKTRGIVGEIQLGRILEQMFASSQYREQVNIQGANAVDYALILPGKSEGSELLLPIDSKFPMEDYQRLQMALESNEPLEIDKTRKALFNAVKAQAKSISEKYIVPPKTTDFAIMFLPTEGLFMEVVNNPELYEQISRDYKINVTGPTTMTAVLNSLQMGFKTLQIEQKSAEVYEMLGAVKTEFDKFEGSLIKVQQKIQQSEKEINNLITTRTNVMKKALTNIDRIDDSESSKLLDLD